MIVIPKTTVTHKYCMDAILFIEKYPYPMTIKELIDHKKSKVLMVKLSPDLKEINFFKKGKKKNQVTFYFWLPNKFNIRPSIDCEIDHVQSSIDYINVEKDESIINEAFRILSLYDQYWY